MFYKNVHSISTQLFCTLRGIHDINVITFKIMKYRAMHYTLTDLKKRGRGKDVEEAMLPKMLQVYKWYRAMQLCLVIMVSSVEHVHVVQLTVGIVKN